MEKLKQISLGIVIGMLIAVILVIRTEEKELEALEASLAEISGQVTAVETVSVEEQAMKDIVKRYAEISEVEDPAVVNSAPYNWISLDDKYQIYLEGRCNDLGIDFFFALALMESESSFDPNALGDSGRSVGLFQINKVWWDVMQDKHGLDVQDPVQNIEAGLIIINDLFAKYPDDPKAVIQCYKCGEYRGEELIREGFYISACDSVMNRAEVMRKRKEA